MIKLFRRMWRYLSSWGQVKFDENADAAVQLQQAIVESNDQHNRVVQNGASVIAMQKKIESDLNDARRQQADTQEGARQALILQDRERKAGNVQKADLYGTTAQSFATKLIGLDERVDLLETQLLDAARRADEAKAMVRANGLALQKKLSEKNELLSRLEQAKVQESYNKAMGVLTATIGEDVPTFDEIRDKINMRLARAQGMGELQGQSVEAGMLQVQAASMDSAANERLKVMAIQLGIEAPEPPPALPSSEDAIVDATLVPDSPAGVQAPVTGRERNQ